MFERITDTEERGQVGIGTLIVFIALVLVAAIAAGVLINTAGFLQSQAEQTGEQSSDQVTDRLETSDVTGNVTNASTIDQIDFVLQKAPGASDINVSAALLSWSGPDGTERFGLTNTNVFLNDSLQDEDDSLNATGSDSFLIMNDRADQLILTFDTTASEVDQSELQPGETAEVTITGQSGSETIIQITVPNSLSGESSVGL
jgi:flagellin-like protein